MNTKLIFCSNCQIETPHAGVIDGNGEYVFTCQTDGCGRFIKLPADYPIASVNSYFDQHAQANIGQVSVEAQEKKLAEIMASPSVSTEATPNEVNPAQSVVDTAQA